MSEGKYIHKKTNTKVKAIFFDGNNQKDIKKIFKGISESNIFHLLDLKYKNTWLILTEYGLYSIYDDDRFKKEFKEVGDDLE